MTKGGDGLEKKPFMDHVRELQLRAVVSFLAVILGAGVAYQFNEQILYWVRKPLDQTLYYTSPIGGFSSLFKLCIFVGFTLAVPVILYNIFKFFSPLLNKNRQKTVLTYTFASAILAYAGVAFAYFVSLPAALHFLSKFAGENVQSLITIDEYYNFAFTYLISFALVFQLPLYVLFINKVTPLSPGGMMKAQRYIILFSFVGAAILTPTPDPFNQTLMAAPAIVLYQVGFLLVLISNYKQNRKNKIQRAKKTSLQQAQPNPMHSQERRTTTVLAKDVLPRRTLDAITETMTEKRFVGQSAHKRKLQTMDIIPGPKNKMPYKRSNGNLPVDRINQKPDVRLPKKTRRQPMTFDMVIG